MHEEPRQFVVEACEKLSRAELVGLVDQVLYSTFMTPDALAKKIRAVKRNTLLRRADEAWRNYEKIRETMASRFPDGYPTDGRRIAYLEFVTSSQEAAKLSEKYSRMANRMFEVERKAVEKH